MRRSSSSDSVLRTYLVCVCVCVCVFVRARASVRVRVCAVYESYPRVRVSALALRSNLREDADVRI